MFLRGRGSGASVELLLQRTVAAYWRDLGWKEISAIPEPLLGTDQVRQLTGDSLQFTDLSHCLQFYCNGLLWECLL